MVSWCNVRGLGTPVKGEGRPDRIRLHAARRHVDPRAWPKVWGRPRRMTRKRPSNTRCERLGGVGSHHRATDARVTWREPSRSRYIATRSMSRLRVCDALGRSETLPSEIDRERTLPWCRELCVGAIRADGGRTRTLASPPGRYVRLQYAPQSRMCCADTSIPDASRRSCALDTSGRSACGRGLSGNGEA